MANKGEKRKEIKKKLLHKYRLVILNENTFEEKISFKLSRLNVFVTGSLFIVALIAFTTVLIAFTPLREYIPGYSSTKLKRQATELTYKTYLDNIRMVLNGDIANNQVNRDSLFEQFKLDPSSIDLTPIREDSLLREQVEMEDKYSLFERDIKDVNLVLFPPVGGTITQEYNPQKKHYAVDVVAVTNTPVKAVADGMVIFAEWTAASF
mgnify:CR=1 FL=1